MTNKCVCLLKGVLLLMTRVHKNIIFFLFSTGYSPSWAFFWKWRTKKAKLVSWNAENIAIFTRRQDENWVGRCILLLRCCSACVDNDHVTSPGLTCPHTNVETMRHSVLWAHKDCLYIVDLRDIHVPSIQVLSRCGTSSDNQYKYTFMKMMAFSPFNFSITIFFG